MSEPRFVFRAAAALELRRRRNQEAEMALERANAAVFRAEQAVVAAQSALTDAFSQPVPDGGEGDWYRNWILGLRTAIVRRTEELGRQHRVREDALAQAVEARRALRAVERLRDRRLRAFELEATRREQRRIDELGIQRYQARKSASGGPS